MSAIDDMEQRIVDEAYQSGYEEGLRVERERVLISLKDDLKSRFIPSTNQWSKGRNSGLLECCNIIDEILQDGNNTEQKK